MNHFSQPQSSLLILAPLFLSTAFPTLVSAQPNQTPSNNGAVAAPVSNGNALVAKNAQFLGTLSNGCKEYIENAGTDNARFVIVKDGKRNEFPTLKEDVTQSANYIREINQEIIDAHATNISCCYKQLPYSNNFKPITELAQTARQIDIEAMLAGNSDVSSLYLQTKMEGYARIVLNKGRPQAERQQAMIRFGVSRFCWFEIE